MFFELKSTNLISIYVYREPFRSTYLFTTTRCPHRKIYLEIRRADEWLLRSIGELQESFSDNLMFLPYFIVKVTFHLVFHLEWNFPKKRIGASNLLFSIAAKRLP